MLPDRPAAYDGGVLSYALHAAEHLGAYVHPVDHPSLPVCVGVRTTDHPDPATCEVRGKHPATPRFSIDSVTGVREITAMFAGLTRNYGINMGRSRLLGIDEDPQGDGKPLDKYAASIGETVPETFTVRTGRPGGRHLYFRLPAGLRLSNRLGKLAGYDLDVRAGNAQLIGPGSLHASGSYYTAEDWTVPAAPAPAWLIDALTAGADDDQAEDDDRPPLGIVPADLTDLLALPITPDVDKSGRFHHAVGICRRAGLNRQETTELLTPWCQRNGKYKGRVAAEVGRCWGKVDPPAGSQPASGSGGSDVAPSPFTTDGKLLVNNPANLAHWLRTELGSNALSGMFLRSGELVYTPREGEDGYLPPGDGDDDGPAQVRPVDASRLASRCQYTFTCVKRIYDPAAKQWITVPALFPASAAKVPVDVPDMLPNVRRLRGVIHAPVLRPDGSILERPGYDEATGLLHLPEPGLRVPAVPDQPTAEQVAAALALVGEMLAGFVFASDSDRANYLGLLLTPALRTLLLPPYKLGCIGAPMPGSGKSLLASILRKVHGGVFRAEVPDEESELRKQVTTVLDVTTGPVVQFDNATGVLRSSTLAALLTSPDWDDRLLGTNRMVHARNDRLWIVTGNNLTLGGDLVRRALWVTVDPGVPDPHLRTGFAINDLESWVRDRRGELLHALLVLARSWLAAGAPKTLDRSDSYAEWSASLRGLLRHVGVPGKFDAPETARQSVGADDSEWATFLERLHQVFGDKKWLASDVVNRISRGFDDATRPIPVDAIPQDLADKLDRGGSITRSLGKWLANREGRWAGGYAVRSEAGHDAKTWTVHKWKPPSDVETGTDQTGVWGLGGLFPATSRTRPGAHAGTAPATDPKQTPQTPNPRTTPPQSVDDPRQRVAGESDSTVCPHCDTDPGPSGWGPCSNCRRRVHRYGAGSHGNPCPDCRTPKTGVQS